MRSYKMLNMSKSQQSTNKINMVWSPGFRSNEETIHTNFAQNSDKFLSESEVINITEIAHEEFSNLRDSLQMHGVIVNELIGAEDSPDCIFPNNTFSTHPQESTVVFYPMLSDNRHAELSKQRQAELSKQYDNTLDLRNHRNNDKILEGTGSLVLDRINKIAYASSSPRTNKELTDIWSQNLGYETVFFDALDSNDHPVYHTNVVMWVGTKVAAICLDSIPDINSRIFVKSKLESTDKTIITISKEQMDAPNFAGNALELQNANQQLILAMSDAAWKAYTPQQQNTLIEHYPAGIIHEPIPTIEEFGGGSVRCMIAEIF